MPYNSSSSSGGGSAARTRSRQTEVLGDRLLLSRVLLLLHRFSAERESGGWGGLFSGVWIVFS